MGVVRYLIKSPIPIFSYMQKPRHYNSYDTVIEARRNLINPNKKWERFKLWFKMHKLAWRGYVGCTLFALIMLFIQHQLDSSIKTAEKTENRKQDSLLRAEYFAQIKSMQEANVQERNQVRQKNKRK